MVEGFVFSHLSAKAALSGQPKGDPALLLWFSQKTSVVALSQVASGICAAFVGPLIAGITLAPVPGDGPGNQRSEEIPRMVEGFVFSHLSAKAAPVPPCLP
jgi:hypothetical protein